MIHFIPRDNDGAARRDKPQDVIDWKRTLRKPTNTGNWRGRSTATRSSSYPNRWRWTLSKTLLIELRLCRSESR